MRLFESLEQLEQKEELLKQQINQLPNEQKKEFYKQQYKKIKDPDTYATLNWFCLGGLHHLYLKKYITFIIEITFFISSIIGLILGYQQFILVLFLLALYELPQLFFSQKLVRQYNYEVSCKILDNIKS